MSALVWLATAIYAASVVAIVAYLWWYGMREESYDFTADEKPRPLLKRQHDVQFMVEAIEELRGLGVDLEADS